MYQPYREYSQISIKIPWDKYTARGFGISLAIYLFLIFLFSVIKLPEPKIDKNYEISRIPIEMLNFGDGDGTGISKGNLSAEGRAYQSNKQPATLEDASKAGKTILAKAPSDADFASASRIIPKQIMNSEEQNKSTKGTDNKERGLQSGTEEGTGLGEKGIGPGAGYGFGDIEWGGGGNRRVLVKVLPKFPPGVNTSAQIRIRFTVAPDGTVTSMFPLQKADPVLEKAAMDALRQWRFNPINEDKEMWGIIPLTFVLR